MTIPGLPPPHEYIAETKTGLVNEVWYRWLAQLATQTNEAAAAVTAVSLQVFTANGTYTPADGMAYALVIGTAGGGQGGGSNSDATGASAGGGGQAGGTFIKLWTAANVGASAAVVVGAGGTSSNVGANGADGSDTTVTPAGTGSVLTADGGDGGDGSNSTVDFTENSGGSGEGGTTNGDLNIGGGNGRNGVSFPNASGAPTAISGDGGTSFWGGGARGLTSNATPLDVAGLAGAAYGSGGSGAITIDSATGALGGNGAQGVVFILEFKI